MCDLSISMSHTHWYAKWLCCVNNFNIYLVEWVWHWVSTTACQQIRPLPSDRWFWSSHMPPICASLAWTQWVDYLLVVNHLNTTNFKWLCMATHLPCAHWNGRSHNWRSAISCWLWLRVSGSPNRIALWHAKLLRMARREGGTICIGCPASVHYRHSKNGRANSSSTVALSWTSVLLV